MCISQLCGGHGTTQQRFLPFLLLTATAIPVSVTIYCGGFDQAVENAELSNIFAHPTSIPIGGFLCQPGVHFRLWPTGPCVKTHVNAAIGYTTINHTLFAPLPGFQTAKALLLIIRLPYLGDRPMNYPPSRRYSVLVMCCPHRPFERQG